jgi:pimeloyl-ACP methyl ester carboxylesterase
VLIRVAGLETFYQAEGEGPAVVLLHGWAASCQSLEGVSAALAGSFRVIRIDLPGFGWSQAPPAVWGTAEYAGQVLAILESLGIGRAAVLGHSFGGRVAIVLAATQPSRVARLTLVASAGIRPRRTLRVRARLATSRLLRGLAAVPGLTRVVEPLRAAWSERVGSRDYRAAGRLRPILVKVVNEDLRPLLPRIATPTLILWGDRDEEVGRAVVEIQAAEIPGARLRVFSGAGHFPFQDAPGEFMTVLREFLGEGERW